MQSSEKEGRLKQLRKEKEKKKVSTKDQNRTKQCFFPRERPERLFDTVILIY